MRQARVVLRAWLLPRATRSVLVVGGCLALAAGCALTTSCAAAHPTDDRDLPTLKLTTDRKRPDPVLGRCPSARDVALNKGPVPEGQTVVARLTLTALDGRPQLATYESVLREWAAKHCCSGVSVLRGEAISNGDVFSSVVAAAWTAGVAEEVAGPDEREVRQRRAEEGEQEFWRD